MTLKDIPSWTEYRKDNLYAIYRRKGRYRKLYIDPLFGFNSVVEKYGRFIISVEWANGFTTLLMVQSSSKPMHIKDGLWNN